MTLAIKVAEYVMANEYIDFVEYISRSIPGFDLDQEEVLNAVLLDAEFDHPWKDARLLKESIR